MDSQKSALRALRSAVSILLVAMYVAGLVAMLPSRVQLGLILWVVSTLGGIGLLYWIKTRDKNRKAQEEAARDKGEPEA